jgi:ribosomal protein S18 acetylase RimI-like enzyme
MNMKKQNIFILDKKIAITQLTPEFAIDLMRDTYFSSARRRGDVLNYGLRYEMLKAIKLIPRATRLVAYHVKEKTATGFLYLEENTDWLYTIEYVFVDPKYRRMGLATKLIQFALMLAKEKGAKKVNLNVACSSTKAIELYGKMGFRKIGHTLLAQRYLSGSPFSRLLRRTILGQGCLTKLTIERKSTLVELEANSRKNRDTLFDIYQRCMNQEWVDFFEINPNNIAKGSRHVWQPLFFKDVLINDLANSYALIFNSPLSSNVMVELYSISGAPVFSMLDDLLKVLAKRGVSFAQITLFNPNNNEVSSIFEEKGMMTFNFIGMGKII